MELQVKIQVWYDLENTKDTIERLVEVNLKTKLDNYLKKFEKKGAEWLLELKLDKNKKWLFNGVLQVKLDWTNFRYEREDYKNLDDLVNHLFNHLKEELSRQ
jgi:hypothetical protein